MVEKNIDIILKSTVINKNLLKEIPVAQNSS